MVGVVFDRDTTVSVYEGFEVLALNAKLRYTFLLQYSTGGQYPLSSLIARIGDF
jgi:hypothetical protein